jgi:hypothetical protein
MGKSAFLQVALLLTSVSAVAVCVAPAATATRSATHPFSVTLTYHQTNPGKDSGQWSFGIEGKGTISTHISGVPAALQAFAKPSKYAVRFDIDPSGTYHGVMVVTAGAPAVGSLCVAGDIGFGKYDPNAGTGFPPSSGPFHTVGGAGLASALSLSGRYKATKVSGSEDTLLNVSAQGTATVSVIAPKALTKACLSVAKLGRR